MSRCLFPILLLLWLSFLQPLLGDTITTLDGQKHVGTLRLTSNNRCVLVIPSGPEVDIAITNLLSARLDAVASTNAARQVPSRWEVAEIGELEQPGKVDVSENCITFSETMDWIGRGEGDKKKDRSLDSCRFVYKRLQGPGSIVARVRESSGETRGRAGLMWRQDLNPGSPFALLARTERYYTQLLARDSEGKALQNSGLSERGIIGATWLKLVRESYAFAGYESADGTNWTHLGEMAVLMPEEEAVLVGVIAACGSAREVGSTNIFEQLAIATATSDARDGVLPKGVVARTGSRLAGEIVSARGDTVVVTCEGEQRDVGLANSAWLIFKRLSPAQQQILLTAKPGALLFNGDFVEGEFQGLENGQAKLNSVLFGIRQYEVRAQIAAIVLRPMEKAAHRWTITLHNQSLLQSEQLAAGKGALKVSDSTLGTAEVPWGQVAEIRQRFH